MATCLGDDNVAEVMATICSLLVSDISNTDSRACHCSGWFRQRKAPNSKSRLRHLRQNISGNSLRLNPRLIVNLSLGCSRVDLGIDYMAGC